ncbi:16S rRNA (guanine(966)-N(2))-methyltransferase RsmD [Acidobacteriota bacterium]
MIRVIGGMYRGKRLRRVPSTSTRPMPDKLKESLLSIIQKKVRDSIFLDGFAGTGSVGIEALSRGAKFVVFIDQFHSSVKTIQINLEKCDAESKGRIIEKEFNRAVIQLAQEKKKFDIIFLDPPYALLDERNPLKVIKKRGILNTGGIIILRRHFKTKFVSKFFELQRQTRIGDDILSFYINSNPQEIK